jgi:peptide/nickel transport system substrate-binding protein
MWRDNLDICTSVKPFETGVWQAANAANENHAFTWWLHPPRHPWHEYGDYIGIAWQTTYAPEWYRWYESGGEEGIEPPEEYLELRHLQEEMFTTPDIDRQVELWELIKANVSENLWLIPMLGTMNQPIIWSADLSNVPERGVAMTNAMSAPNVVFFNSEERLSEVTPYRWVDWY